MAQQKVLEDYHFQGASPETGEVFNNLMLAVRDRSELEANGSTRVLGSLVTDPLEK